MDWGFVTVDTENGKSYKIACFAMICHHCGQRYIEFFPNAKQENLFIGMIHAFMYMGVPRYVLIDNMKSVVIKRDYNNKPIWQKDYELFMGNIGFDTKLCKPRHPFTKGAVERLVRFVKENFLAERIFTELTDLNYDAIRWCNTQNAAYHRAVDCISNDKHSSSCIKVAPLLEASSDLQVIRALINGGEYFGEDSSLLCALDRIFDDAMVFMIKGNSYRGSKCETVAITAGELSPLNNK